MFGNDGIVGLLGDDLAAAGLKPAALKGFILANREALLAEAGLAGWNGEDDI